MAEKTEDDLLFQEIDEELRQDKWLKLWKAYGKYAVAAVALLVVSVAGVQGWRAYDLSQRRAAGERFHAAMALAAGEQADAALKAFAAIAKDGGGYGMLARFHEATLLARRGDAAGAAGAYWMLADDAALDPIYRNLATILGALQELNVPGADGGAAAGRLEPLTAPASPWRHSAREIKGLFAHRAGRLEEARGLFDALAADISAPQGVRQRAQEMLSILAP